VKWQHLGVPERWCQEHAGEAPHTHPAVLAKTTPMRERQRVRIPSSSLALREAGDVTYGFHEAIAGKCDIECPFSCFACLRAPLQLSLLRLPTPTQHLIEHLQYNQSCSINIVFPMAHVYPCPRHPIQDTSLLAVHEVALADGWSNPLQF